jgi:hypothetical protein
MAWVDRPVAAAMYAHFHGTTTERVFNAGFHVAHVAILAALVLLFAAGWQRLRGSELGRWAETPVVCASALMWAMAVTLVLKDVIGRSWPDPSYVERGIYEFHFLHGESYFNAFPSMTMAGGFAIVSILWIRAPGTRVAGTLVLGWFVAALVVTNSHWASDIIAGAYVGALVGAMTERMLRPRTGLASR